MRFTHTGITEMAFPHQILDDLVDLFRADRIDPLVRHISAAALLKSLTVLDMEKREALASIFVRRQSDLLAAFAVGCNLLPSSPARRAQGSFWAIYRVDALLLRSVNR
jgi:hypothetical protein